MDISFLNPDYSLKNLDFLNIGEVYAIPGVRQCRAALPVPDHDLSIAMLKGECSTAHHYWNRGTIIDWLAKNMPDSPSKKTVSKKR